LHETWQIAALTAIRPVVKIRPFNGAIEVWSADVHADVTVLNRWRFRRAGGLLLAGAVVCGAGGCFSLGGRTTYVQQSPETDSRLRALETRVAALEQAFTTRAATPPLTESGMSIIGQANSPRPYKSADQTARDAAVR